jgi:hypothetical protein
MTVSSGVIRSIYVRPTRDGSDPGQSDRPGRGVARKSRPVRIPAWAGCPGNIQSQKRRVLVQRRDWVRRLSYNQAPGTV